MTLIVDLDSYKTLLDKTSVDIENANGLAVIMSERYTKLGHANYLTIFYAMTKEIRTLRQMYDTTVRNYRDHNTLRDNSSEERNELYLFLEEKLLTFCLVHEQKLTLTLYKNMSQLWKQISRA